jgi:Fe-S cluster biogenesis protein NfuA
MTVTDATGPVERVEALLDEVERLADPVARETANGVAAALLELYGTGLARMVEVLAAHDDGTLAAAVTADPLVEHLLLLHGLHPVPVEERVRRALEGVRPYLESHGGDVELLGVEDGVARLRMEGSCKGCPSSAMTLKLAIESAVLEAAPDVERIEAEEQVAAPPPLLQIEMAGPAGGWTSAGGIAFTGAGPVLRHVEGRELVFVRVDGTQYAYAATCPGCGSSLASATLRGVQLACTTCDHRYDVRHAGRCLDAPELHLQPVPLLMGEAGEVSLALAP